MPHLPVTSGSLFYTESGSAEGRPMLLLHAALQTHESMEPLVSLLTPLGLRLVMVDLRGHGQSANPSGRLSVGQMADDVASLIAHLRLGQPLLAGYSIGGMVGLELALRGLLSGLVVLASRIRPSSRARETFAPGAIEARSPLWAKQLAERHVATPWRDLATQLGETLATWSGFPADGLAQLQIPVLVVQGDRDQMVPLEQGEELASLVPGGQIQVVPRAGHPELLYRSDAKTAVSDFVRSQLH